MQTDNIRDINKNEEVKFKDDLVEFNNFVKSYADETIDLKSDPVCQKVKRVATLLARSWGFKNGEEEDLFQEGLSRLSESNYRGDGSLKNYIYRILINLKNAIHRSNASGRLEELTDLHADEIPDVALDIAEEVSIRLESERFMAKMLESRPEIQADIIKYCVEFYSGKKISREEIIRNLNHKYPRYKIIVAYRHLEAFLGKFHE